MGLFDKTFGKNRNRVERPYQGPEHAVLVEFLNSDLDLSLLFELEGRLEEAITAAGVGEFDGNELALDGSHSTLYMYGPNADALFGTVRPILEASDLLGGARARLRYGPPEDGVREEVVYLNP